MKTILYVAPFFGFPPTSGADLRAVHLAEQLSLQWKVIVLIRRGSCELDVELWAREKGIQIEWLDCRWISPAKGNLARILASHPPGFAALDPACITASIKAAEASHGYFDLIFLATQLAGQVLLAEDWQTPVVVDLYDVYSPLAYQRINETSITRPYHWLFRLEAFRISNRERRMFGKARLCLLPSDEELQDAQTMFSGCDFAMIPNGVTLPEEPAVNPTGSQVLMIGSLHHKPNLEGFTWFYEQVWQSVIKAKPLARLCLVGSGQELLTSECRNDPSMLLAGQVPDLGPYYKESCCAVVPILRGGGTRLKLLEAMSWGIPVVTTSAGCAGIQHQDTVLIADDPSAFGQKVVEVLSEPVRFSEWAGRARQVVASHYTWDGIGERLRRRLDSLLPA